MRPPSRESGWRRREDQGLNPACSIPKRAGRERELAEVTQGVTSEVGNRRECGIWEERVTSCAKMERAWYLTKAPSLGACPGFY